MMGSWGAGYPEQHYNKSRETKKSSTAFNQQVKDGSPLFLGKGCQAATFDSKVFCWGNPIDFLGIAIAKGDEAFFGLNR